MSSTNIFSLAVELLEDIAGCHSQEDIERPNGGPCRIIDLRTLRLVCRLFKLIVDPLVFSVIRLDFDLPQHVLQHQMSILADDTSFPSRHCRTLRIQRRSHPYKSSSPEIDSGYDMTRTLKSLHNMRAVHWNVLVEDINGNMIVPVIEGLNQLPQLEELDICLLLNPPSCFTGIFPLDRFRHRCLRRLALTVCANLSDDITQQFCKVVKQNPLLASLDFDLLFDSLERILAGHCTYRTIMQDIPSESPLPLCHLRLHSYNLSFENSNLSHLKFLSSIDIASSVCSRSNYNRLWLTLAASLTWLKEISVDEISQNLLDYLTLYSGLTKFCFFNCHQGQYQLSQEVDRFFSVILPRHQNSLSILGICTRSPEFWGITPAYMSLILILKKLRSLTITLAADAISSAHVGDLPIFQNIVLRALRLPCLRVLNCYIDFSGPNEIGAFNEPTLDQAEDQILSMDVSNLGQSWEYFKLQVADKFFVIRKTNGSDGRVKFIKVE